MWTEVLNTDAVEYAGGGRGNLGGVESASVPCHNRQQSIEITLPPLSTLIFVHRRG